jgi:hypothetical protein
VLIRFWSTRLFCENIASRDSYLKSLHQDGYTYFEAKKILQEGLVQRLEQNLDLNQRGFVLSYKSHQNGYVVIYDSPKCRLRSYLSRDPRDKDDTIGISYGRSHAPDEEAYYVYLGENCLAWHHFIGSYIGQFLDGTSPQELAHARMENLWVPCNGEKEFKEREIGNELRSPVWGLHLEQFFWNYYGDNLFNLFDLRYPQQWKDYRHFLREFYDEINKDPKQKAIYDNRPVWMPRPWQVC